MVAGEFGNMSSQQLCKVSLAITILSFEDLWQVVIRQYYVAFENGGAGTSMYLVHRFYNCYLYD